MPSSIPSPRVHVLDRLGGVLNTRGAVAMRRLANLETRVLGAAIADVRIDRPVYVCGLARAGTTLLLELLASVPGFTSHRYADFPFLWTPYWWNALRARLGLPEGDPVERAHRDRVRVTFESPEAFEEIFWTHFFPHRHETGVDQVLDADAASPAFDEFYRAHLRKLLAVRGATRYVAKGNYNLVRIGYLLRLFPQARFVVAVREPRAHVASLVRQDRQFRAWAQQDPRIGAQLARRGHFEFGPGKRALHVGDARAAETIAACFAEGREVEGYARQWIASYGWLIKRFETRPEWREACLLVRYDRLCASPQTTLSAVLAHAAVDDGIAADLVAKRLGGITAPDYYALPLERQEECETVSRLTDSLWRQMVQMC